MATEKRTNKSYRLMDDRTGTSFLLKVGRDMNLTVYDEKQDVRRAIRHCPNEKTIFIDEQSKHALVEQIIFEYGYLEVPADRPLTQQFLDQHPDNHANGGNWFESVDEEKESQDYVKEEDLKHEIRTLIIEKSKEDDGVYALEMVASVLTGSLAEVSKMKTAELKRLLYTELEVNPHYFTDDNGNITVFDDQEMQRKYLTLRALSDNIIKKSPNGRAMHWSKDNKKIAAAPVGVDLVEYFAEFLSTDEGILVSEEISKRS